MSEATESRETGIVCGRRIAAGLLACLVAATACLPFQSHHPDGDEQFYFAVLRSLYFDGDVDLRNEAEQYPWLRDFELLPPLPDGGIANPFAFGSTLLWLPFYAVADLASNVYGADRERGFARAHRGAVAFGTSFWVFAGLLLLAHSALALGATRGRAAALALVALSTTPLVGYITHAPTMAHGNGFFMCSAVLWMTLSVALTGRSPAPRWALLGILVGFAFCVRWQDALFVILPAGALWARRHESFALNAARASALAAGIVLGVLPQLAYWRALYGRWLLAPLGPDFVSLAHADPLAFSFSTWNGVFSSHPVLLAAFLGLLLPASALAPWARAPWLRISALTLVLVEALLCMSAMDWWAGGSFGQRRLVSILPLLVLGLWALVEGVSLRWPTRGTRAVVGVIAVLTLWNLLSLAQLRRGALPYNPADPAAYASGETWGLYDHGRRARQIVVGRRPERSPRSTSSEQPRPGQ